jgi:hypothetical protein
MESKNLSTRITPTRAPVKTPKPAKGCKCKENLLAAVNLRGDFSKGQKDKIRDMINQEMK